ARRRPAARPRRGPWLRGEDRPAPPPVRCGRSPEPGRKMITRPTIKPSFHVEPLGEEGIFLLTETAQVLLRGRLYCTLAPLLDGRRSADELVDLLEEEASAAEVYY